MRALMVQGTSSGAGKSTLVAALCRIFRDRGYSVCPFKSQNMSRMHVRIGRLRVAGAQAVQAAAAGCPVTPDINPVLLEPLGDDRSALYVGGRYVRTVTAKEYYAMSLSLMGAVRSSMRRLAGRHDLMVIEGAGSPAEINLRGSDIANMRVARAARAPVLLVSDMERGGSFAAVSGTLSLLGADRGRVRGLVFNNFRGDPGVLAPGLRRISRMTGVPVAGVIPHIASRLPDEDSLGARRVSWDGRRTPWLEGRIRGLARAVSASVDVGMLEAMA
ncbi:MAG: cobyric acid synthase [Nitrosopumilus sp.]|nr:cobyric acid synthase [Nitrosopumilus sp.]